MPGKTLLIRADAGAAIGVGHVMRCIALAEAWRNEGGQVIFALAKGAEETEKHIRRCESEVVRLQCEAGTEQDIALTSQLRTQRNAEWVILDGYQFSQRYIESLRIAASHLLMILDGEQPPNLNCDMVVNPELGVSEGECRSGGFGGELLLGPRYALLRQEFLQFANERRSVSDTAHRILVTFGGGDEHNVTLQVLRAFNEITGRKLDLSVVVGPTNPHRASLEEAASRSRHKVRLVTDSEKMAVLMSQCDLAVAAGGGTTFELAFMQVPMFLITTAKNQGRAIDALARAKAAIAAGWFQPLNRNILAESLRRMISDSALRRELAANAGRLIDGRGAERIVHRMFARSEPIKDAVESPGQ